MGDQDFEKLGAFYLGRRYDPEAGQATAELLLYDSKDLVTHALCVGMTGSGKTGLCIGLLEEAAIDGVPAIIVDPKGDLANLMLKFPELRPEDFLPWVNADDAARKGMTLEEYASAQAGSWREGLAQWGQDGARIRRLSDAAEVQIYTPGSSAGLPVSILKSFDAPPAAIVEDEELLAERVATTVTGLLGLLGIDADPLNSREHILISTILDRAWRDGGGLDLAGLIQQIQTPPVERVGVMQVDAFFPPGDRFALATSINNLLAAPKFQAWLAGEPLDIGSALRAPDGRPRLSIFSIAHLSDEERMFFVTLLLAELLGWVRAQQGTTSLRAIFYMDEIAGYFPPVANPPSKAPLLTLLKQARAFGLGVVLATQNPVDLDYKGLSNAGTWFVGRLQTEQDKARLMEGLQSVAAAAGAGFDASAAGRLISELPKRTFLMNNVHEEGPVVFQTRWCLCYLAGPATRAQIKQLMAGRAVAGSAEARSVAAGGPVAASVAGGPATTSVAGGPTASQAPTRSAPQPSAGSDRPLLPPEVAVVYLPVRSRAEGVAYAPRILGQAQVRFVDQKAGINSFRQLTLVAESGEDVDWDRAAPAAFDLSMLQSQPDGGVPFAALPVAAGSASSYKSWSRDLASWAYATQTIELMKSPASGAVSTEGESEADFRGRLSHEGRERRDAKVDELRERYAAKAAALEEKRRRAEQAVAREADQARQAKMQTAMSVGSAVLGVLLGGRKKIGMGTVGRATTAARGAGRAMQQSQDVARAEENVAAVDRQLAELEAALQQEVGALQAATDPLSEVLEPVSIRPKKADISVERVALLWEPVEPSGAPAW